MKCGGCKWHCACGLRFRPSLLVRCPQGQIVAQKLHDERRVFVGVLGDIVKLCDCILKRRARHFACFVWVVEDLVLEDRKVEGKTKPDGMGHCQVLLCYFLSIFICQPRVVRSLCLCVTITELCDVAVVVGLHLLV